MFNKLALRSCAMLRHIAAPHSVQTQLNVYAKSRKSTKKS